MALPIRITTQSNTAKRSDFKCLVSKIAFFIDIHNKNMIAGIDN
jgi:hypothetical protein